MKKKEIQKIAGRYPKFVEWSEEDKCFIGRCPMLFDGAVHGADEAKVYKELCETAEEWIKILNSDGVPLPKEQSMASMKQKCIRNSAKRRRSGLKF